ncbi:hypothetical protein PHJA_001737000, partial [Phtheirospermum japonicum]
PPLYLPTPPPQKPANAELDAILSILETSEKVVERLQKQEENMLNEVTQRAKDLHTSAGNLITAQLRRANDVKRCASWEATQATVFSLFLIFFYFSYFFFLLFCKCLNRI